MGTAAVVGLSPFPLSKRTTAIVGACPIVEKPNRLVWMGFRSENFSPMELGEPNKKGSVSLNIRNQLDR